jgi:hypothetical protein
VLRRAGGLSAQEVVDHAVGAAIGAHPVPRDDIAVIALRALDA